MRTLLAGMAMAMIGGAASATTVSLGFEDSADCSFDHEARAGNVTWSDSNKCMYDDVQPDIGLGDDGWSSAIWFTADAGTRFTPLAFDVLDSWLSLERAEDRPGFDPEQANWQSYAFDYMALTGYRDGAVVASSRITPVAGSSVALDASFALIDRFSIKLLGGYWGHYDPVLEEDGYWYRCSNEVGRCHFARIDNLVADIVAPVPLPATAGLLGFGVLTLAGLTVARRAARRAG